ncbi:MAG: T9SS type A sorting domain-containing protein [Ferruginibacter sp.]|nr:T9SS type A sorting domain-containing protein [Cytophagales bacterium]
MSTPVRFRSPAGRLPVGVNPFPTVRSRTRWCRWTVALGWLLAVTAQAQPQLVKDIRPGADGAFPGNLTNVDVLYFTTGDPATGFQLWRSDGTPVGTVLVQDRFSDAAAAGLTNLTNVDGILYFVVRIGTSASTQRRELWRSDGTPAGTVLVKTLATGYPSLDVPRNYLINLAGTLYFTDVAELWKTNGTPAGTVLVKIIPTTRSLTYPTGFTASNGLIYFAAEDVNGREPWQSDGTTEGTGLLKNINPSGYNPLGGSGSSGPERFTDVNGVVYFSATASDSFSNFELWKSDGTAAGTVLVKEINPPLNRGSNPTQLTSVNGLLYFVAGDDVNGRELWRSDGTAAGTVLVKDIHPGPGSSDPVQFTNVDGVLYFAATNGVDGQELWKSDGTAAGTVLVKDIHPGPGGSDPVQFTNVDGVLYFAANDATSGQELWKSDGTPAGTGRVGDIRPGTVGSDPAQFTNVGGVLYFSADEGVNGRELWKYNLRTPVACSATGTILREQWNGVAGNRVGAIPLNTAPASSSQLTCLEAPTNVGENYGARLRGYLCAPQTGKYIFWLASDDDGKLYLSSDENPANKRRIAYVKNGWATVREWDKYASQRSKVIHLVAGRRYYVEVLHKEATGGDNLAVGWRTPLMAARSAPVVVPGSVLSPFVPTGARLAVETDVRESLVLMANPNPFSRRVSVSFTTPHGGPAVLTLYDLRGVRLRNLYQGQVVANEAVSVEVDGSGLKEGMYVLNLTTPTGSLRRKLVLVR